MSAARQFLPCLLQAFKAKFAASATKGPPLFCLICPRHHLSVVLRPGFPFSASPEADLYLVGGGFGLPEEVAIVYGSLVDHPRTEVRAALRRFANLAAEADTCLSGSLVDEGVHAKFAGLWVAWIAAQIRQHAPHFLKPSGTLTVDGVTTEYRTQMMTDPFTVSVQAIDLANHDAQSLPAGDQHRTDPTESPPAECQPFADISAIIDELPRVRRAVLVEIIAKGGRCPLPNVALLAEWDRVRFKDSWASAKREIRKWLKRKKLAYRLVRDKNDAVLEAKNGASKVCQE
jgi:hypothetical protein